MHKFMSPRPHRAVDSQSRQSGSSIAFEKAQVVEICSWLDKSLNLGSKAVATVKSMLETFSSQAKSGPFAEPVTVELEDVCAATASHAS